MQIDKTKLKIQITRSVSIFLMVLSIFVIFGWLIDNNTIVRIFPIYTAMVFNTALSILLLGISLFLVTTRFTVIVKILCVVVGILNLMIIFQYIFEINLFIDELIIKSDLTKEMNFPGRTSLNSSIVLFFSSIAIYLLTYEKNENMMIIALILSCFVLSVALASLFGYITGLQVAAGWANFSRMAVHTALSCLLIGFSIFICSLFESLNSPKQIIAFPVAVFLSILVASLGVWQAFEANEYVVARKTMNRRIIYFKNFLDQIIREDIEALDRFAQRWEELGGYTESLWKVDGGNYIHDLPGLQIMQAIDANFKVLKKISRFYRVTPIESSFSKEIEQQLKLNQTVYNYDEREDLLVVYLPLFVQQKFIGTLLGYIHLDELFNMAVNTIRQSKYQIYILKDNETVFQKILSNSSRYGSSISAELGKGFPGFQVQFYLTEESVALEEAEQKIYTFFSGFILAILGGIAAYLAVSFKMQRNSLVTLNEDLKVAKKNADEARIAKSTFLASMSHEIRTPLNAVIGTIQLMQETHLDETQVRYLQRINFSSRALLNLINDILDFSKIEAGSLQFDFHPCNLHDITKNVLESFMPKASEKKIDLLLDVPSQPLGSLITDGHRLEQILMNLLNNSIKFTEKGFVKLKFYVKSKFSGKFFIRFEVIDTGIGISKENQGKLFQKFSQVEVSNARKYGGVGLGLSICRLLAEKFQGKIGVESEEGKGSTFWIELPLEVPPQQDPIENYSLEGKKVLLIDSFDQEREILMRYLTEWKAQVSTQVEEGNFAIVSFDQNDVIQKISEKKLPIIYIENSDTQKNPEESLLLIRPVFPKSLWELIKKIENKG